MKNFLKLSLVLPFLFLAGCKIELYTDMPEEHVNQMLGLLLDHGISAEKQPAKAPMYTLMVESKQVAQALELLQGQGYPKQDFTNLGALFTKEGLISSPTEERIRYLFGISQEVSETLTQIDGVLKARVHVVVPEPHPGTQVAEPSSASVLIKYNRAYDIDSQIPQIKLLVANSVQGLTYERVTVVLFPALDARVGGADSSEYKPTYAKSAGGSIRPYKGIISTVISGLLVLSGLAFIYTQVTRKKAVKSLDDYENIPRQ